MQKFLTQFNSGGGGGGGGGRGGSGRGGAQGRLRRLNPRDLVPPSGLTAAQRRAFAAQQTGVINRAVGARVRAAGRQGRL